MHCFCRTFVKYWRYDDVISSTRRLVSSSSSYRMILCVVMRCCVSACRAWRYKKNVTFVPYLYVRCFRALFKNADIILTVTAFCARDIWRRAMLTYSCNLRLAVDSLPTYKPLSISFHITIPLYFILLLFESCVVFVPLFILYWQYIIGVCICLTISFLYPFSFSLVDIFSRWTHSVLLCWQQFIHYYLSYLILTTERCCWYWSTYDYHFLLTAVVLLLDYFFLITTCSCFSLYLCGLCCVSYMVFLFICMGVIQVRCLLALPFFVSYIVPRL